MNSKLKYVLIKFNSIFDTETLTESALDELITKVNELRSVKNIKLLRFIRNLNNNNTDDIKEINEVKEEDSEVIPNSIGSVAPAAVNVLNNNSSPFDREPVQQFGVEVEPQMRIIIEMLQEREEQIKATRARLNEYSIKRRPQNIY